MESGYRGMINIRSTHGLGYEVHDVRLLWVI